MNNLMQNAGLWKDDSGNQPPACWDGTHYVVVNQSVILTYQGTHTSTDKLSGYGQCVAGQSSIVVTENGSNVATQMGADPFYFSEAPAAPKPATWNLSGVGELSIAIVAGSGCSSDTATFSLLTVGNVSGSGVENGAPVVMAPVISSPVTGAQLVLDGTPANGSASVSGSSLLYTANADFSGTDSFRYYASTFGELGTAYSSDAIAAVTVAPGLEEPCQELGRTTRNYVSGYTLSRQAVTRVRRQAKRCVIANFNGALPAGRTIVSARWETTSPWSLYMSNPRIAKGQRETMVDVSFNFAGWGGVLCTVTLDNGELYNAEFSFTVIDSPLYPSATYDTNNGPYRLDVSI